MIERTPWLNAFTHLIMAIGLILSALPILIVFVASSHDLRTVNMVPMPLWPGGHVLENYALVWEKADFGRKLMNSLIVATAVTSGKVVIAALSAFAIVYFKYRLRMVFFWLIFVTLMLPVEVRIMPTYQVMSDLGLLDTYTGLTLPLIASATATFLFRQFFLTVPEELTEAARIDGAGPMRFFFSILLPLSRTNLAALFVILFILGWNQYLWPLLMTTQESMYTVVIGIKRMIAGGDAGNEWNVVMATALLAMLPPAIVVVLMQKWFVKGLVDTEK
jgi:sn-glycerol 3-phosphate transport system permease protein